MLDIFSYLIGLLKGKKIGIAEGSKHVIIEGDGYVFTDSNNDGNIVITEVNE